MNIISSSIEKGKEVIRIETDAIMGLRDRINESFAQAVELMFACRGRIVVTGIGKSGLIARKIVATLNSTGTPSLFLHPSDAIHGDLGTVRSEDILVCLSKSGDTAELNQLLPTVKRIGVQIIALVGNTSSKLAQQSSIVLDVSVKEEACPLDLAPTSSSTAMLVMGDALAMALLDKRKFTREDFAFFHPGGNLGKRLLLKVEELMVSGDSVPRVHLQVTLRDAILEMTSKRLGATCVVDSGNRLMGIITDGDLRRLLQKTTDLSNVTAEAAMIKNPKTISKDILAVAALQQMEAYSITQLVVVDEEKRAIGMVHLHELVRAGLGNENQ
ncbi:MAG: KpsF/GutQ family sugar-phosphate isomerase [Bacteroidetes bacterium]|nr:MAG: KpsF/GutQ family sugar-phosphate isomerase [Bacteroidota bacterium]